MKHLLLLAVDAQPESGQCLALRVILSVGSPRLEEARSYVGMRPLTEAPWLLDAQPHSQSCFNSCGLSLGKAMCSA